MPLYYDQKVEIKVSLTGIRRARVYSLMGTAPRDRTRDGSRVVGVVLQLQSHPMKRSSESPEREERRLTKRHRREEEKNEEAEEGSYVPYIPLKERRRREVGH